MTLRIISGSAKGRKLKSVPGDTTRPVMDRVKEALFDILAGDVIDSNWWDLFGGTGAIGIEALSRGARQAVFIESATRACRLIRRNAELCGISSGCRIVQQDAFMALRALAREGFKASIVFFDPPYDFKPYGDLLEITFTRGLLSQSARVVIEHHRKSLLPESGKGYNRLRVIRQGDHCLSFYEEDGSQSSDAGIRN